MIRKLLLVLTAAFVAVLFAGSLTACEKQLPKPGSREFVEETRKSLNDTYSFIRQVYEATASEPVTPEEQAMLHELALMEEGETPIVVDAVPFPMVRFGVANEKGYELALPNGEPMGRVLSPPYSGMMLVEELSHLSQAKSKGVSVSYPALLEEEVRAGRVANLYWGRVIDSGLDYSPKAPADGKLLPEFEKSYNLFVADREEWEKYVRDMVSDEYNQDGSIKSP